MPKQKVFFSLKGARNNAVQAEMIALRHRKDQYEWSRLILIVLNTKMQTKMQYVPRIATKQSCNLPVNMEKE